VWLLAPVLGPRLGLPTGVEEGEAAPGGLKTTLLTWAAYLALFLPGAVAGGALGWFIIRPVNWALGKLFRGFNRVFDGATRAYRTAVGSSPLPPAIGPLIYARPIGPARFRFSPFPRGVLPHPDTR